MTTTFQKLLPYVPLYRPIRPRRFHAFCVGAAKTGTHSLSTIFETNYRAAHEPSSEQMIRLALDKPTNLKQQLRQTSRRLWLEMNSSQVNGFLVSEWAELFPEARFVLTIREPVSWLRSLTNHQLARPLASPVWHAFRQRRFATDASHTKHEQSLADRKLFTLDGYLRYWQWHNQTVLNALEPEQLLVMRTSEIGKTLNDLAAFLGIAADTLNQKRTHSYRAKAEFDVVDNIDPVYLQEKVDFYCGDLLKAYF